MGRKRILPPINETYGQFGEKIKALRLEKGMTQDELSKVIGVGKTTIVNYETGTRKVPLNVIIQLSEFFGVSVDTLIGVKFSSYDSDEPNIFSSDPYVMKVIKLWTDELGKTDFNDDELAELISFAKYLKSKRGE